MFITLITTLLILSGKEGLCNKATDSTEPSIIFENIDGGPPGVGDGAESIRFTYIDELTDSAELWKDGRKLEWLQTECDFTTPCGFGAIPVGSATGAWRSQGNVTWRVYKENIGDESGAKKTTGLGFRSRGAAETFLLSDPVPCLEPKTGSVKLKVRLYGDLLFRICFVSMKTGKRTCGTTVQPRKYGYSTYNMDQPIAEEDGKSGELFIRVEFIAKDNSFALIEKISYIGQICLTSSDQMNPTPTTTLQFDSFKLGADPVSMQNVLAVLLNNQDALNKFTQDLYSPKSHRQVYHACKALRCHKTSHLCMYDGRHGATPFILKHDTDSGESTDIMRATVEFQSNKAELAMFSSDEFFDRHSTDTRKAPQSNQYVWRFITNEFAHTDTNMTVCFLYRTYPGVEESCVKPRLHLGPPDTSQYNYLTQIPEDSLELRLVVSRLPGNFKAQSGNKATIVIKGFDVIGC